MVGGGTAGASPSQDRLANVYSSASVALATGAKIYGDVYAPLVSSRGGVELLASAAGDHSIYSAERKLDEFTVFEAGGTGHLTTEQALSRTGTLTFSGAGKWVTVAPDSLKSPFSADGSPLRMFVPNFPVTLAPTIVASSLTASAAPPSGALNSQGALYQVASGGHLTLNSAAPDATGKPAVFVVLAQNATPVSYTHLTTARATPGASTPCTISPTPFRTPSRASPTPCAALSSRTTAPCTSG